MRVRAKSLRFTSREPVRLIDSSLGGLPDSVRRRRIGQRVRSIPVDHQWARSQTRLSASGLGLTPPRIVHGFEAGTLAHKASGFILAHNRPSGDPTPSAHDRELTQAVKAAAATVGIRFLDHLIIGDAAPFSFKANGLL